MSAQFENWIDSRRGRAIRAAEATLLTESLDDCFGWELLQVGSWGEGRDLIQGARTRRATVISGPGSQSADIVSRLAQLPILSDSVDAVVLPHTLEFEADPYAVLREADRVLTGEGKLLVLGFAPLSIWGLRSRLAREGFPPGQRRLLSERRLRDWLVLLGYEVDAPRRYLFDLPWGEPARPTHMLRRSMLNPLPAGAFLLKARKRVFALHARRLKLREPARVIGAIAKPAANRHTRNHP